MALKTALLQILEEHRDAPVSGQALADRLHVSRAAVWKAMKALQAEGHRITAVTNRGYQLERDSDVLTPQGIRCRLRPAYQDCAIRVDARVPSTNTRPRSWRRTGRPRPPCCWPTGRRPGRGRMERAFFYPPGTGLYMSVLLQPGGTGGGAATGHLGGGGRRLRGRGGSRRGVHPCEMGQRHSCGRPKGGGHPDRSGGGFGERHHGKRGGGHRRQCQNARRRVP